MRILVIATSIRHKKESSGNYINGLRKILGDIYFSPLLEGEKYFWTSGMLAFKEESEDLKIISPGKVSLFLVSWYRVFKLIISLPHFLKSSEWKRKILDFLRYGYFTRLMRIIRPEIVHIHDLSDLHKRIIEYCLSKNIPCVLTLHLYIGKETKLDDSRELQKTEYDLFTMSNIAQLYITGVSSNISHRILTDYHLLKPSNIYTILNGTKSISAVSGEDIRKKHNIPIHRRIFLCIGKICERKNQIQILRALKLMSEKEKESFIILFIGAFDNIEREESFRAFCDANSLEKSVLFIGQITISDVRNYYSQSDFVISSSINESFGLTFIEGFTFGLPSLTFSDLDAMDDIYNENVMHLVKDRTDEDLKVSILSTMKRDWDRKFIRGYANQYSLDKMVENYNRLYRNLIK